MALSLFQDPEVVVLSFTTATLILPILILLTLYVPPFIYTAVISYRFHGSLKTWLGNFLDDLICFNFAFLTGLSFFGKTVQSNTTVETLKLNQLTPQNSKPSSCDVEVDDDHDQVSQEIADCFVEDLESIDDVDKIQVVAEIYHNPEEEIRTPTDQHHVEKSSTAESVTDSYDDEREFSLKQSNILYIL